MNSVVNSIERIEENSETAFKQRSNQGGESIDETEITIQFSDRNTFSVLDYWV